MTNAHITGWIPTTEATSIIKKHIEDGLFEKKQIKKSSYRWADVKDHSKGYLCRVVVEAGIHPELEIKPEPKPEKPSKKEKKTEAQGE